MTERRRILLLGNTGKLGQALTGAFAATDEVIGHNSSTFDARDFDQVRQLIDDCRPDLLLNTVVFQGIDQCEKEPEQALRLNTLLPKLLAETAATRGVTLVHFSTDSVFNDTLQVPISESAIPCPLNIYGQTKYGGDCFVQNSACRYYLIRIPLLFGPNSRQNQFVEKMLARIRNGERTLRVAGDVISSPSLSTDIALGVKSLIDQQAPYGLYHLANQGQVSLYTLMCRVVSELGLNVRIECGSHSDFPAVGVKNTNTPLRSEKIPPLRSWEEALSDYCATIAKELQPNV